MLRTLSSSFIRNITKFINTNNIATVKKDELRSAGIIVIGDEILKGQVHDTNSYFIVKNLYRLGVKVRKITVVGDIEDEIVNEVKTFSKNYTYVITTGGIGPTHDDITFQAVAKAFGDPLVPHPELVRLISDYYKTDDLSSAPMKMAHIPKSARLTYGYDEVTGRKTLFPNVSTRNVYMFPGIPQLMEKLFDLLCKDLFGGGSRQFYMKELYLNTPESNIASSLNLIVAEFPRVTFGSYPKLYNRYFKVQITAESENEDEMKRAYNRLKEVLNKDVVEYDSTPLDQAYDKVMRVINESSNLVLKKTLDIVEDCLQKYSSDEIYLYIDGGIQTVCMLHVYYALLLQRNPKLKVQAFYLKSTAKQKEVDTFISETISRYNLQCEAIDSQKSTAFRFLTDKQPVVRAIIIGNATAETQKTGDYMKKFEENTALTNIQWITPLIDWKLDDIQKFVTSLSLPFCEGHEFSSKISVLMDAVAEMNKATTNIK